jgi:predicted flap endonuclease-1-like 5' DNA nuclease
MGFWGLPIFFVLTFNPNVTIFILIGFHVKEADMSAQITGLIIGLALVVITLVLILLGRGRENASIDEASRTVSAPAAIKPDAQIAAAMPGVGTVDDLALIEGIGPRIVGLLQQQGITTFAQLAAVDIPRLEQILRDNSLQFVKPDSWPEQARLAAEGRMGELKALQDRLTAGR